MKSKVILLFLLTISLCGCSVRHSNSVPEHLRGLKNLTVFPNDNKLIYHISFKRNTIYNKSQKVLIGRMGDIAVDHSGRVYIVDIQQKMIHMFNPTGRYITHIGRKGRGPGEFVVPPSITITSNQLYAYDLMAVRLSIFSLDSFTLTKTINLNLIKQDSIKSLSRYWINQIIPESNGRLLAGFGPQAVQFNPELPNFNADSLYEKYYFLNDKAKFISNEIFQEKKAKYLIAKVGGNYRIANFSFIPKSIMTVNKSGYIYSTKSNDFLISEYDSNGQYLGAFYYPFQKAKLTRKAAMESQNIHFGTKYRQSIIKRNALPKTWPAINDLKIDSQNRLWVSTIVKNMKVYQWWVLNPNGKLIARFNWPRNKPIEVIKKGYIYTRETDTTTGISKIVRYRIVMQKHSANTPSKKRIVNVSYKLKNIDRSGGR